MIHGLSLDPAPPGGPTPGLVPSVEELICEFEQALSGDSITKRVDKRASFLEFSDLNTAPAPFSSGEE